MIDKILDLLIVKPLQPFIELFIIIILIRDLKNFISNWDVDYRQKFKEDIEKLKLTLKK